MVDEEKGRLRRRRHIAIGGVVGNRFRDVPELRKSVIRTIHRDMLSTVKKQRVHLSISHHIQSLKVLHSYLFIRRDSFILVAIQMLEHIYQ